jgi:LPXTG-motif cell wall-anchored protein
MAMGAAMCDLPFTGPSRTSSLLLAGSAALGLGLVLVATATRRERILARVTALESARVRLPR